MKFSALTFGLWLAGAAGAAAQVTVEVTLDQDQFLVNESLPAEVRVVNRSGQTLHLGDDNSWLTFSVEPREGGVVSKLGDAPVAGTFTLGTSKRARKSVDLAPYFDLTKPGRYTVTATVSIKEWNRQINSPGKAFDIVMGTTLWEQEFGMPASGGATNQQPEVRKYSLQQANYLKSKLMLYFRLSDPNGKGNKVYPIGPMLSFGQPSAQVDRASNLHVLYQNGPHSFGYTKFNTDGKMILKQTFDLNTQSRPRLQADDAGDISVTGGVRRPMVDDVPTPMIDHDPLTAQPPP